jgi:potassium channel subfamily K protein 1
MVLFLEEKGNFLLKTRVLLNTSNQRLGLLIAIYIIYIIFGASIFDAIESPNERRLVDDLNKIVKEFHAQHKCLNNEDLNKFIQEISIQNGKGISPLRNVSGGQKWTFGETIFFSGTVLTTIGYGNVSPQTKGGKLFCMLFAICGIPFTLILLTALIERLMTIWRSFLLYSSEKLQHLFQNWRFTSTLTIIRILFAFIFVLFVLIFFMLIPAAIYSSIEGWSYLNSFYYCFISLSTVGLGDYVPGDGVIQDHRHFYKLCSTAYLIIGVLIMVWLLEIFSEIPEFNLYRFVTLAKDGERSLTNHPAVRRNSSNYIQTISSNEIGGIDLRVSPAVKYDSTLIKEENEEN